MNRSRRRGFTLLELMVVVAIIAVVAAFLVPFFQKAYAIVRWIQCSNNLEKIGQAYATRQSETDIKDKTIPVMTWPGALDEFVGRATQIFICPEDDASDWGKSQEATLREVYVEVFTGAAGDYGSWAWDVPLDESAQSKWIWRLSEEQFQEFMNTPGYGIGYAAKYQGYVPGADPTTYWFMFEDQGWKADGGDKNYRDLGLKVHYAVEGITITTEPFPVGYNFYLSIGRNEDKKVLVADCKNKGRTTVVIPGTAGRGSYGINRACNKITTGKDRLLVMDYELLVASGSSLEKMDDWSGKDPLIKVKDNGVPVFARHFGSKVNVLFANGSVRLMDYRQIDPHIRDWQSRYWNP